MAKPDLITGLDMGSGRISCVIGTPDPEGQGMRILGGAHMPCRGLKGGVVLNIHETARVVRAVVEKAEEEAQQMIQGVYLGVRGSHLHSFNNRGAINIARTDKEITAEDVAAVIETAKAVAISSDREILDVIPQGFALDRERGVPDPVGMEGSLLDVEVHIITASRSHLSNLTKAVAEAGFDVIEPVYSLLALGEFIVSAEERELGALLLDFGGQSISLGIYSEGGIVFSKELAIGSDFITRDLAVGLRTNMPTAETLKIKYGVAHPSLVNGDSEIQFKGVDGRTSHTIKTSTMTNIILPRVEEIFTVVSEEVQNSQFADSVVPGGAILSGGGALLNGIPLAAEQIMNMPARMGLPHPELVSSPDKYLDAKYATALSLVCYPQSNNFHSYSRVDNQEPRWMRKMKSFFKDFF
ncbi:MAG: cell division protein FtsA [Elusimicrobiota bacterium]